MSTGLGRLIGLGRGPINQLICINLINLDDSATGNNLQNTECTDNNVISSTFIFTLK